MEARGARSFRPTSRNEQCFQLTVRQTLHPLPRQPSLLRTLQVATNCAHGGRRRTRYLTLTSPAVVRSFVFFRARYPFSFAESTESATPSPALLDTGTFAPHDRHGIVGNLHWFTGGNVSLRVRPRNVDVTLAHDYGKFA